MSNPVPAWVHYGGIGAVIVDCIMTFGWSMKLRLSTKWDVADYVLVSGDSSTDFHRDCIWAQVSMIE